MTTDQIKQMNSEELRKAATQLGIKNAKTFKKEVLVQMALDKIEALPVTKVIDEEKQTVTEVPTSETIAEQEQPVVEEVKEEVKKDSKKKSDKSRKPVVKKGKDKKKKEEKEKPVKTLPIDQKEVDAIVKTANMSKSDKFEALAKRGLTPAQVATSMDCNYSFVYGVLRRRAQAKEKA